MKAKRCWKAFNGQYGNGINSQASIYRQPDWGKKPNEIAWEAYHNTRTALKTRYDEHNLKNDYRYKIDTTWKSNSIHYRFAQDLKYGMRPILQGIEKMGYKPAGYPILGDIYWYHYYPSHKDGITPSLTRIELHFRKNYLTIQHSNYQKQDKKFYIDGNLPIEKYLAEIQRIMRNQFLNVGQWGKARQYQEKPLYELLEMYRTIKVRTSRNNAEYNPHLDYTMIEQHLIRRLRKKNNIILVNEDKIEKEYPELSKKRYKKLTKVNTRAKYITYADLESEAWTRGQELDDTNLEEIFFDVCDDLGC